MTVLITGASGFVGRALVNHLLAQKQQVCGLYRSRPVDPPCDLSIQICQDLSSQADAISLDGVKTIVHCAAHVHQMGEQAGKGEARHYDINYRATVALAERARLHGVEKFVFLSSIKVNGEQTRAGTAFTEQDAPKPEDAYGKSKAMAEEHLLRIAREGSMAVVIIRPPLVYGPGVKANFHSLINFVKSSPLLPFVLLYNKRSLVGLDNLLDFIQTCIYDQRADGEIFLVSDDQDMTLQTLCKNIADALNLTRLCLPVPGALFRLAGKLSRKSDVIERLCNDLCVDISKARNVLGWTPPFSVQQQIERTTMAITSAAELKHD